MMWNHFDLFTAALILLIGLKGLYNGTVRELAGLVGVALGVLVGSRLAPSLGRWISDHLFSLGSASAMNLIAFLFLLFLTWALSIFLGILIIHRFNPSIHSWLDRLVGFLFASLKVFLIVAVIVYALSTIEFVSKNAKPYIEKSRLYPLFITTGHALMRLPEVTTSPKAGSQPKEHR